MDASEDAVRDALREVIDPEAGMNIVDLGLVYGIELAERGERGDRGDRGGRAVKVLLTMTSAACPMVDMIAGEVHAALAAALPADTAVEVELVWDPPWTPERMSGLAREQFGWAPR